MTLAGLDLGSDDLLHFAGLLLFYTYQDTTSLCHSGLSGWPEDWSIPLVTSINIRLFLTTWSFLVNLDLILDGHLYPLIQVHPLPVNYDCDSNNYSPTPTTSLKFSKRIRDHYTSARLCISLTIPSFPRCPCARQFINCPSVMGLSAHGAPENSRRKVAHSCIFVGSVSPIVPKQMLTRIILSFVDAGVDVDASVDVGVDVDENVHEEKESGRSKPIELTRCITDRHNQLIIKVTDKSISSYYQFDSLLYSLCSTFCLMAYKSSKQLSKYSILRGSIW